MWAKQIQYGDNARKKMYAGIAKLAKAVMSTMWPKWRNVILERSYGAPTVTNDGVTIAKEIELSDKFENIGAALVKEASSKTNDAVGDGTTTTVSLAYSMATEGMRYIDAGVNPFALSRGMHKAVDAVITELRNHSNPVSSDQDIKNVATISAQDEAIGSLLSEVIAEVSKDGVVTVEEGKSIGLTKSVVKGMQFDQWYASPYFVTDPARMESIIENPMILVTDKKISVIKDILPLLEWAAAQGRRDMVIIAEDVDGEALTTLVLNKLRWVLNVVPVKAPWFGDRKKEIMRDICAVTGATMISEEVGLKLESATIDMLWSADKIIIWKDKTTIVWGRWDQTQIDVRVESIRNQIMNSSSSYDKEKLQERLARLVGGVAVIKVWAATEMEMKNKKYKIEDALNATRAAVEEWVVAGGWTPLLKIAKLLDNQKLADADEQIGMQIVLSAIQFPVKQIANNAGYKWDRVVEQVKASDEFDYGFNAASGQFENLVMKGIIDPTKVVRVTLENAVSAAAMFLTTDCVIADLPKDEKDMTPWNPGMWGMGGMWWMGLDDY
jgi:chaperonin GroEL